jgi:hypothetical protein
MPEKAVFPAFFDHPMPRTAANPRMSLPAERSNLLRLTQARHAGRKKKEEREKDARRPSRSSLQLFLTSQFSPSPHHPLPAAGRLSPAGRSSRTITYAQTRRKFAPPLNLQRFSAMSLRA